MIKHFFILLLLFANELVAQPLLFPSNHKRYIIKTINIENGLQNNAVNDIITDTFGFTWIGTKTGLQRYNGYRLETVEPVIEGHPLNIDYQMFFLQTKRHMIWMSCKDGILQYNPFLAKFSRLIYYPLSREPSALRPIEETNEGIWCGSDKSLVLYSSDGKKIREVFFPQPFANAISVQAIKPAANSKCLYIVTKEGKLIAFDKQTFRFFPLLSDTSFIVNLAVAEDRLYTLEKQGIEVYKLGMEKAIKIHSFNHSNRFSGTIKIFGNGILANIDQHLLYLDSNCIQVNEITTLDGNSFLPVGFVKYIYHDHFNRLWMLNSNDIRVILNYTVPFQYFAYKDAINFNKSIYVDDEENRVLAGFYDGGVQLYDTLSNPLWKHPLRTDVVKDVAGIEKLDKNEYFITTINRGWFVLDVSKQKFTPVSVTPEEESRIHTLSVGWTDNLQRLDSSLIISTASDVLQCRFLHNHILSADILLHDENKQIYCEHYNKADKFLWVGTSNGWVYGKHAGGATDTIKIPGGYQVRTLTTDAQNNVWIGTDKGLFVYTHTGKPVKTFTTANGLLNDCIYSMLADKNQQTIYVGTNLGLSSVCLNGVVKNYTKERGLQENEFNSAATAISSSGKLYFGGVNGITAFYPSDVTVENDHPALTIYEAEVNDEPYTSDSAIWNKTNYHLAYTENKIAFSLTAFGIHQASDYTYEYKMEGFDKNWTTTNHPVNIAYHLSPGTYHFRARLVDFPTQLITREIIVASPFWQRWWFFTLVFFFLVSLVWLTVRAIYQSRYKEQLQLLQIRQQVMAERERISRDLHDNIGAYASAISANVDEVIYQAKSPNPATMQRLKESAREIIVQLRDSIWALNKETQTIIMLSDRIKNYIQKLQPNYPDISFDVDEQVEQNISLSSITALHLLRIVQEAVHNAVKHSGCSSILISISSQSTIIISIQDNGKGMPASPVYGDGVKNMQARAVDIGWELFFNNKQGGCTIQLTDTISNIK